MIEQYPSTFDSVIQVMDYFKDETTAVKWFAYQRWQDSISCPKCKNEKTYTFKSGMYKCAKCRERFSVRARTIFEDSKIPMRKWIIAAFFLMCHKKGISSYQLSRDLDITQKSAWFMLQRLRFAVNQGSFEGKMKGTIEVDETFVGGKNKNRHKSKKVKGCQGRSFKDKTPVAGLLQRDGEVRAFVVKNTNSESLQPIIFNHVESGSELMTDEWYAYGDMNKYYTHSVIDHGRGQYAVGRLTTNSIEGYWSHLKRSIFGIYHNVSPKHLQRYVDESVFRYNTRQIKDGERLVSTIGKSIGKRLTYKQLIGKA